MLCGTRVNTTCDQSTEKLELTSEIGLINKLSFAYIQHFKCTAPTKMEAQRTKQNLIIIISEMPNKNIQVAHFLYHAPSDRIYLLKMAIQSLIVAS
jgi:hypothetical protein